MMPGQREYPCPGPTGCARHLQAEQVWVTTSCRNGLLGVPFVTVFADTEEQ